MKTGPLILLILLGLHHVHAVPPDYIPAEIDFSVKLREWDGFGFNYVETAQTRDYENFPQDYGGFSKLSSEQRKEIANLIFGQDGLRVQIIKMFLDPNHIAVSTGGFDHRRTTSNMMEFAKLGIQETQNHNDDLDVITTLYGPPAWAKIQRRLGGRDMDPGKIEALCEYMADWVKFLKEEDIPVRYLSVHNEGEDFYRWDYGDGIERMEGFDYNMYWPPELVNTFLKRLPPILMKKGLFNVRVTNGEPSSWTRFFNWGYADALSKDDAALDNLGLLTSHGFIGGEFDRLSYGLAESRTTSLIRRKKPGMHAWVTSFSWGNSGTHLLHMIHEHIYSSEVNAIIPWAGIQNPSEWIDGDPNPNTAITIGDNGEYSVNDFYYFYKQITTAGRRGMSVVKTRVSSPVAFMTGFSGDGTDHPDAFTLTSNIVIWSLPINIQIKGTKSTRFKAFRSIENGSERYTEIGIFEVKDNAIIYDPPPHSTTTFIAVD